MRIKDVKRKAQKANNLTIKHSNGGLEDSVRTMFPEKLHLYKITCVAKADPKDNVTFYDGAKPIFTLNKLDAFNNYQSQLNALCVDKGLTWSIPIYEYALEIDYKTEFELSAKGNLTDVIIWFEKDTN